MSTCLFLLPPPSPSIISQRKQEEAACALFFFFENSFQYSCKCSCFIIMPPLSPQASVKAFILIPFILCRFKMCIQISGREKTLMWEARQQEDGEQRSAPRVAPVGFINAHVCSRVDGAVLTLHYSSAWTNKETFIWGWSGFCFEGFFFFWHLSRLSWHFLFKGLDAPVLWLKLNITNN